MIKLAAGLAVGLGAGSAATPALMVDFIISLDG